MLSAGMHAQVQGMLATLTGAAEQRSAQPLHVAVQGEY